MQVSASDLRPGMIVTVDGQLCQVTAADFHMGGGKMGGMEHTKLRNLRTGSALERRFRPDERMEVVEIDQLKLEYLYQDSEFYVFMNPESYEQVPIHSSILGQRVRFLKENMTVTGLFMEEELLNLQFPEFVDLRVVSSPPPIHDQETTTYKSVTLESGMEILVPPFIKENDVVRVNVETGRYMERV